MKHRLIIAALPLCLLSEFAFAQNAAPPRVQASVVRPTELKAQSYSDAATIKLLTQNSFVEVLSRKASWMEVKAGGTLGWVKMLSLRFDSQIEKSSGITSATKGLFEAAKTTGTSSTVTTGAKGFDKSKFENPMPNLEALAKMKQFNTPKQEAGNFAKQEKLNEQNQAYLKATGDKS
ncbi:hypothetical protein [Undibacterium fentianense]|uniref:SH3 domain-containing protein n=1 Tax=Undibacterium fentianense TaxID=2828728 RepID=A0A941E362_9BURK|nr:hypothetical protein [Undibacterium fentianense]MBR7800631.1 hypothetical protein [Undibacterium fentianense]